jgi:hypothetical protein
VQALEAVVLLVVLLVLLLLPLLLLLLLQSSYVAASDRAGEAAMDVQCSCSSVMRELTATYSDIKRYRKALVVLKGSPGRLHPGQHAPGAHTSLQAK